VAVNRDKLKREADLAEIARRYLKGETQAEIADHVGVNQSTISRDIRLLQKRWAASANADFDAARAEQLARRRIRRA
jgi:IS30 family transposase